MGLVLLGPLLHLSTVLATVNAHRPQLSSVLWALAGACLTGTLTGAARCTPMSSARAWSQPPPKAAKLVTCH